MASTRNRNTPGDYCMEQWSYGKGSAYKTYKPSVVASNALLAGDGLNGGRLGNMELSTNACDIESSLFGIGSTNLVTPKPAVIPHYKNLNSLSIIDRVPLIMPDNLIVQNDQRQYPMN